MVGQEIRQVHHLVSAPLRDHHNATNLLDLWVVWWAHSIQITRYLHTHTHTHTHTVTHYPSARPVAHLCAQVRYCDEGLQDILWQDVCKSSFLDVIRGHVDMVGPEVEVGR